MLGFEKSMDFKLNYAYKQPIKKNHVLSFGISFEYLNKTIDYSQFFFFDNGDPLLENTGSESGSFIDFGGGIYYEYKNKFYAGFSGSQLTGATGKIGPVNYDLVPHYYFMTGYNFTLKKDRKRNFVLATGLLIRSTNVVTQFEINALLKYNDRYWGGLMYRLNDAVGIIAGLKVSDFSIGLSYDYTINELQKAGSKGSPEFFIRYCYPVKPKVKLKGYYNPRYL